MRLIFALLAALACLPAEAAWAQAPESVRLGVVAPLSGPSAILGEQIMAGAEAAAAANGVGGPVELVAADDACTGEGGRRAAEELVADQVQAAIGFLCTESIEAAMPILDGAGIPVLTVGVRTDSLTDGKEKTGWPVFRLAPRADAERAAAADIIPRLWRENLFAIVDDGTIYGRELAESVRAAAEAAALKPVFVDTFRPQMENQIGLVGRLNRAGATHVFVGGDREDVAVMGRDAAELETGLTFAGGENLRTALNEVPLAPGTLMVGLPEWSALAPPEALSAIQARGVVPEGYVLPAYTAVEIMAAALRGQTPGAAPETLLAPGRTFDTVIGAIGFDAKGDRAQNPFRLFRWDGQSFLPEPVP
ncbi:MAG TPA: branched-chain amino acid ABC transporter substrate-binding protein [Mesorhizobium sp.]|jgi:branched-chain amino acid transport system substrate-binding protein|nr:branched-chain amino acid ABC transporter substrate-binding protein [Mesorhizobium sp.]